MENTDSLTLNTSVLPEPPTPQIVDDKSPICIPFILSRLRVHQSQRSDSPFFIGLNGVQGAGKTTLVKALCETLRTQEGLETLVLSLDDLYLTHEDQVQLSNNHVNNPLIQHRGEPGTHDMILARELFTALQNGAPARVPQYDKSQFDGQGDRVPSSQWEEVNQPGKPKVQVIIFEGWAVGFRSISNEAVKAKYAASKTQEGYTTLSKNRIEDLLFINNQLKAYDIMTDKFDAFIHIDAEDTTFVYDWRLQQERALRREKGTGMSDELVMKFVDGYYPAYELFTDVLRGGVFEGRPNKKGSQLRLIVGKDRKVKQVIEI